MVTPLLPGCYKKMFPFVLATTSYIFPDRIVPNVSKLAPFLDEIELVLFEGERENNLPDEDELKALAQLSVHETISYNIHLPLDAFLGHRNEGDRSKAVSVIRKVIDRTSCFNPSLYTLHFELGDETEIEAWRRSIREAFRRSSNVGFLRDVFP